MSQGSFAFKWTPHSPKAFIQCYACENPTNELLCNHIVFDKVSKSQTHCQSSNSSNNYGYYPRASAPFFARHVLARNTTLRLPMISVNEAPQAILFSSSNWYYYAWICFQFFFRYLCICQLYSCLFTL